MNFEHEICFCLNSTSRPVVRCQDNIFLEVGRPIRQGHLWWTSICQRNSQIENTVSKVLDNRQIALIHFSDRLHVTYRHSDQEKLGEVAQNNARYCLYEVSVFDGSEKSPFNLTMNTLWKIPSQGIRFPLFHTLIWKIHARESYSNLHSLSFVENLEQGLLQRSKNTFCPLNNSCRVSVKVYFLFHTISTVGERAPERLWQRLLTLLDTLQKLLHMRQVLYPYRQGNNSKCHLKVWNLRLQYSTGEGLVSDDFGE